MKKIFDLFEYFDMHNYYESNNLLISHCPVHEGDNPTAFNINIDEENVDHFGRWFCNTKSCHEDKPGKDILSLVWMLMEKRSGSTIEFPAVINFCERFCSDVYIDEEGIDHFKLDPLDMLMKIKAKRNKLKNQSKINRDTVRKRLIFPATYYIERGFSEEALNLFDVGICNNPKSQMYNRIVFPVYDENDEYMVGCTGRTICDDPRKWINQKGFNKSNFLYNYGKAIEHIHRTETIILVEGQGDVIRLWESGIFNAVGMFGSKVSDSQEFLIQKTGVSNIIVITDNDEAGNKCYQDIKNRLQYLFNIYKIDLTKNDIGDMSIEEINQTIKPKIQGKF